MFLNSSQNSTQKSLNNVHKAFTFVLYNTQEYYGGGCAFGEHISQFTEIS